MPRFLLDGVISHAEQLALGQTDVLCRTPRAPCYGATTTTATSGSLL